MIACYASNNCFKRTVVMSPRCKLTSSRQRRLSNGLVMKVGEVRRFALNLPEVTEEPHREFSSFRVRGKIFVTVPPQGTHIHVFVSETSREQALALHPAFTEKLFWGGKVRGIRIELASALPAAVKELVRSAWVNRAPKALISGGGA